MRGDLFFIFVLLCLVAAFVIVVGCTRGTSTDIGEVKSFDDYGIVIDGKITDSEWNALKDFSYATLDQIQKNNYNETLFPIIEKSIVVIGDGDGNDIPDLYFAEQANAQFVQDLNKVGVILNGRICIRDTEILYPCIAIGYSDNQVFIYKDYSEHQLSDVPDGRDFSDSMYYKSNSDNTVYEGIIYDIGDDIETISRGGKLKIITLAVSTKDVELSKILLK
ncbi:hypothetical protein [Methanolacinia petrolearia]|uniref:hypothetical protein n=1 Tax=Methanolacinia petrolearia TaxID=54120 RepID=UPI003BAAEDE6